MRFYDNGAVKGGDIGVTNWRPLLSDNGMAEMSTQYSVQHTTNIFLIKIFLGQMSTWFQQSQVLCLEYSLDNYWLAKHKKFRAPHVFFIIWYKKCSSSFRMSLNILLLEFLPFSRILLEALSFNWIWLDQILTDFCLDPSWSVTGSVAAQ